MHFEIPKAGSYIADALVKNTEPYSVYHSNLQEQWSTNVSNLHFNTEIRFGNVKLLIALTLRVINNCFHYVANASSNRYLSTHIHK